MDPSSGNLYRTRITALVLGLALATLSPGCATVGPIAIKCGPEIVQIAAADYNEIKADLHASPVNYSDLVAVASRIGWAIFDCVTSDQVKQDPSVAPAVQEFKRQNAAQFRAAGVSACASYPRLTVSELAAIHIPIPPVQHAPPAAFCDRACGKSDALSTPSGCLCWRASKTDWRASRWVALAGR